MFTFIFGECRNARQHSAWKHEAYSWGYSESNGTIIATTTITTIIITIILTSDYHHHHTHSVTFYSGLQARVTPQGGCLHGWELRGKRMKHVISRPSRESSRCPGHGLVSYAVYHSSHLDFISEAAAANYNIFTGVLISSTNWLAASGIPASKALDTAKEAAEPILGDDRSAPPRDSSPHHSATPRRTETTHLASSGRKLAVCLDPSRNCMRDTPWNCRGTNIRRPIMR